MDKRSKSSQDLNQLINDDDLYEDAYDFALCTSPTFSSNSSLLSLNSTTSKDSQLTDQLYSDDSNVNPVVQVSVRVRPMNSFESTNSLTKKIVDINNLDSIINFKERRNPNEIRFRFKFKNIFHSKPNSTKEDDQEEIFTKIGQPYLQNLLEGNDLSYFAYGQTGSGKSYTIMGDKANQGIVFRFARELFEIVKLNERSDLDNLLSKLNEFELNDCQYANHINKNINNSSSSLNDSSSILETKKKVYEASIKYGFHDVIDSSLENFSMNKDKSCSFNGSSDSIYEIDQSSVSSVKDKILRFNENIQVFKDDLVYQEKMLASESEFSSSLDSLKAFNANEQILNLLDDDNLKILKNIFSRFSYQNQNLKIEFSFKISYYEIYSENIYDLLEPSEERIKSKVREHPTSGPYIVGLTMKEINSLKELNDFYEMGNKRRSKGLTNSNDCSSRSHAIFTIYLTQTHNYQSSNLKKTSTYLKTTKVHSKVSFIDLAGSERALSSGQLSEERLKEGNSINKSLLTLGKVITKLAWINKCVKKRREDFDLVKNTTSNPLFHVPYRDSVLTWLLKDCFSGKCKTFMIATISPASNHYDQTLSTLRYAHKASKIKISFKLNHMTINQSPPPIEPKSNNHESKRIFIEHLGEKKSPKKAVIGQTINKCLSKELNDSKESIIQLNNGEFKSCLIQVIKDLFKDYL